jgi:hypothetical protein
MAAGATYQGLEEDVHEYSSIGISVHSTNTSDGVLTIQVSHDKINWSEVPRTISNANTAQPHMWLIVERHFKIKYVNGTTEADNLSIQVNLSNNGDILLAHQLDETLIDETEAIITRSVIVGENDGGNYVNVPVGATGGLQLDLPYTAFGELAVAENTPQVQVKFPAGLNDAVVQTLTNKTGSTVTAVNGLCTITVAGVAEAFSQIKSLDVVRYGPGQGTRTRFTAAFSDGLADSTLWAGPGDDDEMLGFGYNGTSFGILHRRFGELEVRTLTFTSGGDAGGGTFTLTLDGTAVTITVPSGSATIADVCALVVAASADIFNAGRGWEVHTADSISVTFISLVAENATGTFSFADVDSGVTAGTFNQATTELAGVAPTETITPQASWNIDPMDGTGPSGETLAPENLNVYDIAFQYLGAGNITFGIESQSTGKITPVHMILRAGSEALATFRNPTFHLNMIGKTDAGFSGAAQTIKTSSLAGFIEGKEANFGVRHDALATVSTNGTTEVVSLVLHNEETINGTRNKVEVFPDQITIINNSTRSILVEIFRNVTHLDDGVTLSSVASNSVVSSGSGSGTRQGGDLLLTLAVTASESKDLDISHLGLKLRPIDTWEIVIVKQAGGSDGTVTVGVSWLERI